MANQILKEILGAVRDLYTYRYFNDPGKAPRYRGAYRSFALAEAALPKGKPKGFDLKAVPEFFIENQFMLNSGDYPVLFWLSRLLRANAAVFDLGGGFGQCYYCYGNLCPFPPGLSWTVCDVESFCRRGSELARERNALGLCFTGDCRQADGAQILLSNGALHYIESDLCEMLDFLFEKPQHILINRVPMYGGETFYTMQNTLHSYAVNKVVNEQDFVRQLETRGYKQVDAWSLPRSLRVPFHPKHFVANFRGFYFRKEDAEGLNRLRKNLTL